MSVTPSVPARNPGDAQRRHEIVKSPPKSNQLRPGAAEKMSSPPNWESMRNPLIQNAIINPKSWRSERGQLDKIEIEATLQGTAERLGWPSASRIDFLLR